MEHDLNDVQRRRQDTASGPDCPAPPSVLMPVFLINSSSIPLNITGCMGSALSVPLIIADGIEEIPGGCFFSRDSRTVSELSGRT